MISCVLHVVSKLEGTLQLEVELVEDYLLGKTSALESERLGLEF
jgi:hypothetical protein